MHWATSAQTPALGAYYTSFVDPAVMSCESNLGGQEELLKPRQQSDK